MSTDLQDAPTTMADPFGGGLDKFMPTGLPSPVEKVEPKPEVQAEVKPEVEPKVEVKAEVKAETSDNLLDGISDEPQAIEQTQEEETKEYPPEIRSMKAREHFDALKASKKAAERERDSLKSEVAALRSKEGVKAPEVAVLQKERDEYKTKWEEANKALASTHIEHTEEFKTGVSIPLSEATADLISLRDLNELSHTDLDAALGEPDRRKRNIMLSELAEGIQGRLNQDDFFAAAKKFIEAKQLEQKLYEDAEGSMEFAKTKKEQEEAASKLKSAEEYQSARATVIENLGNKLADLKSDATVWQKIVADTEAVDWETITPKMKGYAAFTMNAYPVQVGKTNEALKEVKRLKDVIASRNAANPGATGGSVTARSSENKGDFLEGMPGL